MSLFKRKVRPPRQATLGLLEDAMGRAEAAGEALPSFARKCDLVRTASGRTAHYSLPGHGVLCGWQAGWVEAKDPLPLCRTCQDEARRLSETSAA